MRSAIKKQCALLALVCTALCGGTAAGQTAPAAPPTIASVTFAPASIQSGANSTLTITFGNANGTAATLTAAFTDFLPPGLTVAAAGSTTCTGGSVAAATGSGTISYSGGAIPPGGCALSAPVTGSSTQGVKYYSDTVGAGALQTNLGANANSVSASLTVQAAVTVPNTVGLSQAAAQAQLVGAGFAVVVTQVYSATVPYNVVVSTQPAAGTSQPRGSTIRVQVSQGPGAANSSQLTSVPGLTPEQQAVARGLQSTCTALATAELGGTALNARQQDLFNKCTSLIADYAGGTNPAGLGSALTAISGRQATAAARIPMQFAAGQITNIDERLSAVRSGLGGVSGLSGLDMGLPGSSQAILSGLVDIVRELFGEGPALGGGAGDEPGGLFDNRLGVFVTGTLRRGTQSETDAESGFDFKNTGITAGADYRLGTSYVLGLAAGYGKSTTTFDDAVGRLDAKHTSIALYGSYFTDRFHLDWQAGYGHVSYDLSRDINYDSSSVSVGCNGVTCSVGTSGATGAHEYNFSVGSGYSFNRGAWEFGPTLEFDYHNVSVAGFDEGGPSGLDLSVQGISTASLLSKLGGVASYAWKTRWCVVLPQVSARYLHEFENGSRTEFMQFSADTLPGAAGRAFAVYTDQPSRNYFEWKTSVVFQFPYGVSGFVNWGGLAGLSNVSTRELNLGVRVEVGRR